MGTIVTISGSGFTGVSSVKFGGVPAVKFTVVSDTSIKATVPTLAITGKIAVGSVLTASTFTVLPGIALAPAAGPPTTVTTVSGSGFGANELVDVYENSTDVVLAATSAGGTFSGIPVTIPRSATPGPLWVSAAGRHSQLAAQKSFNVHTEWANPRRSVLDSGWNPFENVLNTSSVRQLQLDWTTTNGSYFANIPGGVIVTSGLAIAPAAHLATLNALRPDGSQAWSQSLASAFFSGPTPAAGSGTVVASSSDGKLHAFALATGAIKWTTAGPSDTGNGSPMISGSTVFAPGATALQTFNLSTGAPGWIYAGPCTGNFSTPAITAGTVVFTCTDSGGAPYLVLVSTEGAGRVYFSSAVGTTSAPAIYGGVGYLLLGGNLTGYSLSGYYQKWSSTPTISVSTDPAVGDGIVATCGSGGIWVVNAADGSIRFANSSFSCTAPVTIANGVIYEPQAGSIVMWDEYGDLVGRLGIGAGTGPVTVVDGSVYVAEGITGVDRFTLPTFAAPKTAPPDLRQLSPNWALQPYASVQTAER